MELQYLHIYVADFLAWIWHIVLASTSHRLARFFIQIAEFCYLLLCGHQLKSTDQHVEVSQILFRNLDPFLVMPFQADYRFNFEYFATWYHSIEPPSYLNNPCISICYVDDQFVYFLEVEPKRIDELYDGRKHPFFYIGTWKLASKLIKVPKLALLQYAKDIKIQKTNIVYCTHSCRCGSTALVQSINGLKGWAAVSEISWLCDILPTSLSTYDEVKRYTRTTEFRSLVVACIKTQLANFPKGMNVFWKTAAYHEPWIIPILHEFFPDIKIIYMTRKSCKVGDSFVKSIPRTLQSNIIIFIYNLFPRLFLNWNGGVKQLHHNFLNGFYTSEVEEFITDSRLTWYEILWLRCICMNKLFKEECHEVPLLLIEYESYTRDLSASLTKLFDIVGIPLSNLQDALDAYKFSSQGGTIYTAEGHPEGKVYGLHGRDAITKAKCEAISRKLEIPGFEETPMKAHYDAQKWNHLMLDT